MAVFYNTERLPVFNNAVLTIGTFDGVHHGHRSILKEVVRRAKEVNGESIVVTFEPHPRKLLFPDQPLKLITPLDTKLELITDCGIGHIVVVPFTEAFSQLSAAEYVEQFIVRLFRPNTIIIGYDHHFGHDRTGNIGLLRSLEASFGYHLIEIPAQIVDEAAVSSTKIRKALLSGKVAEASHMLGRSYSLKARVVDGRKLGRTLGYPTANLEPLEPDQIVPGQGIYAVEVIHADQRYGGMLSIGYNPTVSEEGTLHIEVNIFEFGKNIYGEWLEVLFIDWLRAEEKFDSLEALVTQLGKDRVNSLDIIARYRQA